MKPLRVEVCLLVAHTASSHLIPEDRCKLFDALPTLVLTGKAGWTEEDSWRQVLGFSPEGWEEFGRGVYAPILKQPEGWGLRPVAEAWEACAAVSRTRAEAGRKGGSISKRKAKRKQTEANAKHLLRFASSGSGATTSGGADVTPDKYIDSKDSQESRTYCFLSVESGARWMPTAEQFRDWWLAYPTLDLPGEFAKMRSWLAANPTRGKTTRGLPRFVNSWLSRALPRPSLAATHADLASVWNLKPKQGVARG